jgi:hypothetical protein
MHTKRVDLFLNKIFVKDILSKGMRNALICNCTYTALIVKIWRCTPVTIGKPEALCSQLQKSENIWFG